MIAIVEKLIPEPTSSKVKIIAAVVGAAIFVINTVILLVCCFRRRSRKSRSGILGGDLSNMDLLRENELYTRILPLDEKWEIQRSA